MPEYRLKKDLPFAKAGEEVLICNGNEALIDEEFNGHITLGLIEELLIEGWIEEVSDEDYVILCDKCFCNKDIEEKTISIFGGGCYKCGTRIGKKCGNYHCITKENYIKHFTKPREFELHLCSLSYGDSLVRIGENGKYVDIDRRLTEDKIIKVREVVGDGLKC